MKRQNRILRFVALLCTTALFTNVLPAQSQSCTYEPPCGPFAATQDWVSQGNTGNYPALVAGDIDQDGIPEVVANRPNSAVFIVMSGATGATEVTFNCPAVPGDGAGIAIGDVDLDGFGEILVPAGGRVYCFEHTGALKYTSDALPGTGRTVVALADFNQDGISEAYVGNYIINAQTGALLASAGFANSKGRNPARNDFEQPVAIDALPDSFCPSCDGLELVAGNVVWAVNLTTGVMTAATTAPAGYSDGYTSVADYDGDGDVDALVQGQFGNTKVAYGWDLQTSTILGSYAHGIAVAGRINIGDLDGDKRMEASFAGRNAIVAIETNFTLKWSGVTQDVSSGITGTSVFDFCGDGTYEVAYRDELALRVYNGNNGAVLFSTSCTSATHIENPLIMDVDGDGQTEIVTSCGTVTIAYESANTPWVPSREVWNQHPYFNVNVNDDLTIPAVQLPHWLLGDSVNFNTFMNQRPPVDSAFQVLFLAADVTIASGSTACVNNQRQVTLSVCNQGDNNFPAGQSYSFYDANPTTGPANLLAVRLGVNTIAPGQCATEVFTIPLFFGTIYAVANDNGTTPRPYTFASFPNTNTGECDFTNNLRSVLAGPCCTPPVITCPANISVPNATGLCGANVPFVATATGTTPTITYSIAPGSFFPVGTTLVTATATNACGVATCTFTVTVADVQPPVLACPANITQNSSLGICGAAVSFSVASQDNCPGVTTTQTSGLSSASVFPVGVTNMAFTATDAAGNTAVCGFTISVVDNEAPVIVCPANQTVNNDPGQCSALVNYAVTAQDNCPGVTTSQTFGSGSGSVFPIGSTNIAYTATDAAGNTAACSFTITVVDHEAPVIVCPGNQSIQTDAGQCGAVLNYTVSAQDNCPGVATSQTSGLGSGSVFPVGVSNIANIATDASGNTAACAFTVTVVDAESPVIVCPANQVLNNDPGQCGAVVNYNVTASDNCTASLSQGSGNGSGTTFAVSASTVTFTAVDPSGNSATCSFTVTVNDNEAPTAVCVNHTVNISSGGSVTLIASQLDGGSSDNCGVASANAGPLTYTCSNLGPNSYVLTVVDVNGNASTATCTVTVTNDPLSVTLSAITYNCGYNVSCHGASNGAISSVVTGGCAPYTYAWNGNSGGTGVNGAAAGAYTLLVTDGNGNTTTASITLSQPAPLVLSLSGVNVLCNGGNNGSVNSTLTGGCAPYSYVWSNGSTSANLSGVVAGTYSLTVTDANGCTTSASHTLTQSNALVVTVGPNQTVYYGYGSNCVTLTQSTTGGTPAYSGVWRDGNNNVVGTNVCPTTTTTYCYSVTDAHGCTATACMTVCVLDVRCTGTTNNGNNGGNAGGQSGQGWINGNAPQHVTICHTPPGQPNSHWIMCLPPSAVPAHLLHGDYLGACGVGGPNFTCTGNNKTEESVSEMGTGLRMQAFPNPTTGALSVEFSCQGCNDTEISLQVVDAVGKVIEVKEVTLQGGRAMSEFNLSKYSNGFYFIVASDGINRLTEKVVKH